jgi:hypothetical protein
MLDDDRVDELRAMIIDRYTPEELIEILGVPTEEVFERFRDECLNTDWEELL